MGENDACIPFLDPLPDLRKDFRQWSIFIRLWSAACHGRPLLVTKIRQREQRTKSKGRVTVTATVWWVTKAELVTKTVSQLPHGLCDQLDLWAAPEFWQRQGLTSRCCSWNWAVTVYNPAPLAAPWRNGSTGTTVPDICSSGCWRLGILRAQGFFTWTPQASDTLRPHVAISTKSGPSVVRLLDQDFKELVVVLRVGVPQFLIFGRNHHVGPEGVRGVPTRRVARQGNLLHLRQRQNRLGFSSWLKVWATARITRRPGCSWTERRSESWAWVRQPTRSKSWAFPSS